MSARSPLEGRATLVKAPKSSPRLSSQRASVPPNSLSMSMPDVGRISKEDYDKRGLVIGEILSTENTYIQQLEMLATSYQAPLMKAGVLTEELDKAIFINSGVLLQLHKQLIATLNNQLNGKSKPNGDFAVGAALWSISPMLKLYVEYVNRFHAGGELLRKVNDSTRKFANSLSKLGHSVSSSGIIGLESLRVVPVQRIPRYVLLLREVLKCTPVSHPDFDPCSKAVTALEGIAAQINEKKREDEQMERLTFISQNLGGNLYILKHAATTDQESEPQLINPHRKMVLEGFVNVRSTHIDKAGENEAEIPFVKRMILLCSDCMCVIKDVSATADSQSIAKKFQLVDCVVWAKGNVVVTSFVSDELMSVMNLAEKRKHTFKISPDDKLKKDDWINLINQTMLAWEANVESRLQSPAGAAPKEKEKTSPLGVSAPVVLSSGREKSANLPQSNSARALPQRKIPAPPKIQKDVEEVVVVLEKKPGSKSALGSSDEEEEDEGGFSSEEEELEGSRLGMAELEDMQTLGVLNMFLSADRRTSISANVTPKTLKKY